MRVITCQCGQRMKVPPELLGKSSTCVRCGARLNITEQNTAPLSVARPESPARPTETSVGRKRIGALLIADGLITPEQLDEALTVQADRGGKTFQILLELGHLNKKDLHDFLARQSGVSSIDLRNYFVPKDLVELVPEEFARENLVLPIDKLGKLLTVGMACPLDQNTIEELQEITGLRVKPMLCKLDDILRAIGQYYSLDKDSPAPAPEWRPFQVPAQAESAPDKPASTETVSAARPPESAPARTAAPPAARRLEVSREEAVARLGQMTALPCAPDAIEHVQAMAESGSRSIRALTAVLRRDPAVVARLLSLANAVPYGMAGRVTDPALAAVLLGFSGVTRTVQAMRPAGPLLFGEGFDFARFLDHARYAADAAAALAKLAAPEHEEAAYAAGLLHEIGRLGLAEAFPGLMPSSVDEADYREEAEAQTAGISHAEAGCLLARQWRLPEGIAEAIRHHHAPDGAESHRELAAVVSVAAQLARAKVAAGPFPADECEPALEMVNADAAAAQRVFQELGA